MHPVIDEGVVVENPNALGLEEGVPPFGFRCGEI